MCSRDLQLRPATCSASKMAANNGDASEASLLFAAIDKDANGMVTRLKFMKWFEKWRKRNPDSQLKGDAVSPEHQSSIHDS